MTMENNKRIECTNFPEDFIEYFLYTVNKYV